MSMTVQTLKIGGRVFVLVAKSDFERMAEQARRHSEDEYWARSALEAEAKSRAKRQKPIPFEAVERELDEIAARRSGRPKRRPGRRTR
jgi:hypothetical protein